MGRSVSVPDYHNVEVVVHKSSNGLRCDCLLEVVFSQHILKSNQLSVGKEPTVRTCRQEWFREAEWRILPDLHS